jgi:uncharacterized protein (TIGR00251 family)
MPPTLETHPESVDGKPVAWLRVRAIPGAKRSGIAGLVGDRLKVKVNAPAEDGKANRAICRLIASELGLKGVAVGVESGMSDHEKTLRVEGLGIDEIGRRLGIAG